MSAWILRRSSGHRTPSASSAAHGMRRSSPMLLQIVTPVRRQGRSDRLRENRRPCVRQHPRASHLPIRWHRSRHRKRRACSKSASAPVGRSQVLRSAWRVFRSFAQARHGYPAKTTPVIDTNARLSRLVAANHSPAPEHGWIDLLTIALGRHTKFAKSSLSKTPTTSATKCAGLSGSDVHVCAPLFEDPTVSICHPTERPPGTTLDPPHATPLRPPTWAQSRCTPPPSRLPYRLGSSETASAVYRPGSCTAADSGAPVEHL